MQAPLPIQLPRRQSSSQTTLLIKGTGHSSRLSLRSGFPFPSQPTEHFKQTNHISPWEAGLTPTLLVLQNLPPTAPGCSLCFLWLHMAWVSSFPGLWACVSIHGCEYSTHRDREIQSWINLSHPLNKETDLEARVSDCPCLFHISARGSERQGERSCIKVNIE